MKYEINISVILPIKAEKLFKMWLNTKYHSSFTGAAARISPKINSNFEAWDGYITGKTLEIIPGKFIRQNWRTAEFTEDQPDSVLEITFESLGDDLCKLHLHHYNLSKHDVKKYKAGWKEYYLKPMKSYFKRK